MLCDIAAGISYFGEGYIAKKLAKRCPSAEMLKSLDLPIKTQLSLK